MHRNVAFTFGLIVYFLVVATALVQFGFGLVSSAILLVGIPAFLLARFSAAPTVMLVTIACFGAGIALILEALAYAYGLWYLASPTGVSLLGGFTIEILALTILKVLFLVLFYELLFDDGEYSIAQARSRLVEFGLFLVGAVVVASIFNLFFSSFSEPTTYYWINIILLLAAVTMLALRKALSARLFRKIVLFAVIAAIPMLAIEYLVIATEHKVLVNVLHPITLPLWDVTLPFGEFLLAFSLPAFITTMYELYLDDRE